MNLLFSSDPPPNGKVYHVHSGGFAGHSSPTEAGQYDVVDGEKQDSKTPKFLPPHYTKETTGLASQFLLFNNRKKVFSGAFQWRQLPLSLLPLQHHAHQCL